RVRRGRREGHRDARDLGKSVAGDPIEEAGMNPFGYCDPTSVQKAVGIAADKRDAMYLAGGQSLIATMKLGLAEPSDLIDLAQIPDLRGIRVEGNGTAIAIGAMTRHAEVAASMDVAARIPALANLAS